MCVFSFKTDNRTFWGVGGQVFVKARNTLGSREAQFDLSGLTKAVYTCEDKERNPPDHQIIQKNQIKICDFISFPEPHGLRY